MKRISLAGLLVFAISLAATQAQMPPTQTSFPNLETRPRLITTPPGQQSYPQVVPETEDSDAETQQGAVIGTVPDGRPEVAGPAATERHGEPLAAGARSLTPPQIQTRIAEACLLYTSPSPR